MPHIHTQSGQHDLTVTAFIVRVDTKEPQVLLHLHKKLDTLLPVGGHVELDETPWQAITREILEESGYDIKQLAILQPSNRMKSMTGVTLHPYPLAVNTHSITPEHLHTDLEYGFVSRELPIRQVGQGESTDLRWLTWQELGALAPELIHENIREIYRFMLDDVLNQWEQVDIRLFD